MPIKIQNDLPARGLLEQENIFAVDELYLLNHPLTLNRTIKLYSNKLPLKVIDEGAASLMDYGFNKIKSGRLCDFQ